MSSDKPRDECGVLGLVLPSPQAALASVMCHGLYALQHRGQESCGMVINDGRTFHTLKNAGLVSEVFTKESTASLPAGSMAVGHVRYGTTGRDSLVNCQPLTATHVKGPLALAHNGNLVNAAELRRRLELTGSIFHTSSDTEAIFILLTRARLEHGSLAGAMLDAMGSLEGSYSLVAMSADELVAARDPRGFRPLCIGSFPDGGWAVASESCALAAVGASFVRDVRPGEVVTLRPSAQPESVFAPPMEKTTCVFEFIYFARPDSVIDGESVHNARRRAGAILAREFPARADVVVGVPDSGLDAALGFAEASGIPYGIGFVKNRYIGRTFIAPAERSDAVSIKLSPLADTVAGKRVVLIDDSIVRGTTVASIIRLLRKAGAAQVHMRVSAPPFIAPCYYGTDVDSKENLIACGHTEAEICSMVGADSLAYLPVAALRELAPAAGGCCDACFTERYPTCIPENASKDRFEA